jgi:hypothetical protein
MEKYSFFDSTVEDEREYSADEFAEYFRQVISTGILNGGDNLQVTCSGTNMTLQIKEGYAWIEGYLYKIESEPLEIELDTADPALDRIDRVVIRLDKRLEHRYIKAFVIKGVPGESPGVGELSRDDNVFEIAIAQVRVVAGKSFVEASQITDERLNSEVCGLANSLIAADTTEIFNKFESWFQEKTNDVNGTFCREWKDWINEVKGASYMTQSQADERYTNQTEFDQLETKLTSELSVFRTSPKDIGIVNAMSIDASFDLTVPDNVLNVTPANTNTGATTISINDAIKSIKKFDIDKNVFVELEEEDIKKNTPIQLTWDKELDFFVFAPKNGAHGIKFEKIYDTYTNYNGLGEKNDSEFLKGDKVQFYIEANGKKLLKNGVYIPEQNRYGKIFSSDRGTNEWSDIKCFEFKGEKYIFDGKRLSYSANGTAYFYIRKMHSDVPLALKTIYLGGTFAKELHYIQIGSMHLFETKDYIGFSWLTTTDYIPKFRIIKKEDAINGINTNTFDKATTINASFNIKACTDFSLFVPDKNTNDIVIIGTQSSPNSTNLPKIFASIRFNENGQKINDNIVSFNPSQFTPTSSVYPYRHYAFYYDESEQKLYSFTMGKSIYPAQLDTMSRIEYSVYDFSNILDIKRIKFQVFSSTFAGFKIQETQNPFMCKMSTGELILGFRYRPEIESDYKSILNVFEINKDHSIKLIGQPFVILDDKFRSTINNYSKENRMFEIKKNTIAFVNETSPMPSIYRIGIKEKDDVKTSFCYSKSEGYVYSNGLQPLSNKNLFDLYDFRKSGWLFYNPVGYNVTTIGLMTLYIRQIGENTVTKTVPSDVEPKLTMEKLKQE